MADNDKPRHLWEYIYPNQDSFAYAQSSANVASTGDIRMHSDGSLPGLVTGAHELDEYVAFNIKGDPRLEKIKEYARELKERYVNPASKDYIADVQEREKTATDLLMVKVHETYGAYSHETVRYKGNARNGFLGAFSYLRIRHI